MDLLAILGFSSEIDHLIETKFFAVNFIVFKKIPPFRVAAAKFPYIMRASDIIKSKSRRFEWHSRGLLFRLLSFPFLI